MSEEEKEEVAQKWLDYVVTKHWEEFLQLKEENPKLKAEIKRLQGNFSHFHICNHVDDACALCGLPVENEVHLRSR